MDFERGSDGEGEDRLISLPPNTT